MISILQSRHQVTFKGISSLRGAPARESPAQGSPSQVIPSPRGFQTLGVPTLGVPTLGIPTLGVSFKTFFHTRLGRVHLPKLVFGLALIVCANWAPNIFNFDIRYHVKW